MELARSLALALVFVWSLDLLVFHTPWYSSLLAPGSAAGTLLTTLWNESRRPRTGQFQVVVVGDSRMSFQAKAADQVVGGTRSFGSLAVPGTTPRCWYYMLREADPNCDRYDAIIVPLEEYVDEDWERLDNRASDIAYLAPILGVSDVAAFCSSYVDWALRAECTQKLLLKGTAYQQDLRSLFTDFDKRFGELRWMRNESASAFYNWDYTKDDRSLTGLSVNWKTRELTYPVSIDENKRRFLADVILRTSGPQRGELAAYRRLWFGKLIERYNGSKTRIVFFRLPRGPILRTLPAGLPSVVSEFKSHPNVAVLPPDLFQDVEKPEYFFDPIHVNGAGTVLLSRGIAAAVHELLRTRTR